MTDRGVRIAILLLLAIPVIEAWDGERRLESRFGESYPGFYVVASRIVAPPVSAAVTETLTRAGLSSFDQIVSVEGRVVVQPEEIWEAARAAGPGVPLRYGVRSPLGSQREVEIPTRAFSRDEAPSLAILYSIGLLWLLIGAAPVLARPALAEARLFFVFTWAASCNFAFLSVDHLVLHRLQPWSFAVSATAIATLIHLAFTFPEGRPPFRAASPKKLTLLYTPAWLGFGGFAALYQLAPVATYEPTVAAFGLYLFGTVALVANIAVAFLRPSEAIHRHRARIALLLPALAGGAGACFAAIGGMGWPEIGAAGFFAGNATVPLAIAWATYHHNLFELDAVVRRGLAAGGAAILVSLTLLASFAWLGGLFSVETASATAALTLVLVLAGLPLSQPLRRRLQTAVDELFYPGRSQALGAVTGATRELARVSDRARVSRLVSEAARVVAGPESVVLVAGDADGALSEIAAPGEPLRIAAADPIAVAVRRGRAVQVEGGEARGREVRRSLAERDLELLLPVPCESGRAAALLLGRRRDGRLYTREDLHLLESLAAQAGLALGSAEAWDELAALRGRLRRANVELRREIARHRGFEEIVGDAPEIAAAREQVARVADSSTTVIVLGETGTGKELIVRALHKLSDRAERPLVRVACAAIPLTLIESELFGHEKGAFTDATSRRLGRFEVADGGTLFLDDVDTLPLAVQAKLLRALQEGEVQRLGSNEVRHVDVRVVSATNRDLQQEVRAGRFREDLYYRLHVVPVRLPALRERGEDIPLLVQHFVEIESAKLGRGVRPISESALEALCDYDWPGNVRELRNVIERAVVMSRGPAVELAAELGVRRTPKEPEPLLDDRPLAERVREFKAERIRAALARSGHNLTKAASQLGLHRQSLSRMVRDLGLGGP